MKLKALCAALCILILTGCAAGQPAQSVQTPTRDLSAEQPAQSVQTPTWDLSAELPAQFIFSSGVGAWMSSLTLNADGTFEGEYHDSEMGLAGEDYPSGTVYICTFQGQFVFGEFLDQYSRRLTLESLITDERPEEEIVDGILYAAAGPHGLDNGDPVKPGLAQEFILYGPNTPVEGLDEMLLDWWPGRFGEQEPRTLECYALWNTQSGAAFFAYTESPY